MLGVGKPSLPIPFMFLPLQTSSMASFIFIIKSRCFGQESLVCLYKCSPRSPSIIHYGHLTLTPSLGLQPPKHPLLGLLLVKALPAVPSPLRGSIMDPTWPDRKAGLGNGFSQTETLAWEGTREEEEGNSCAKCKKQVWGHQWDTAVFSVKSVLGCPSWFVALVGRSGHTIPVFYNTFQDSLHAEFSWTDLWFSRTDFYFRSTLLTLACSCLRGKALPILFNAWYN